MKKILALVMVFTLMCCMMTACDNAQTLIEKAQDSLGKEPYAITIKMDFECDNEEINQIFSLMNMEIPVTVDGKNLTMDMSMDVMGYTIGAKATVVDMVMYYDIEMFGQNVKMKAIMTEEQYQEFMSESNTEMVLMPEDFGELTVETKDGKKYIICEEISEEALEEMNDMMEESLASLEGDATFSDITYTVTLNNGKYEAIEMICVYSVAVGYETVNVTLNMSAEYSYDNIAEITAPADADAYEEVNYSEIMA